MFDDKRLRSAFAAGQCQIKCQYCGDVSHSPAEWQKAGGRCLICKSTTVCLFCPLCGAAHKTANDFFSVKHSCRSPAKPAKKTSKSPIGRVSGTSGKPRFVSRRYKHSARVTPGWHKIIAQGVIPLVLLIGIIGVLFFYFVEGKHNQRKGKSVAVLLREHGCHNCHTQEERIYGPSWMEIAKRYQTYRDAEMTIARSIQFGSRGKWGTRSNSKIMPGYSFSISPDESLNIARYILSTKRKQSLNSSLPEIDKIDAPDFTSIGENSGEDRGLINNENIVSNLSEKDEENQANRISPQQQHKSSERTLTTKQEKKPYLEKRMNTERHKHDIGNHSRNRGFGNSNKRTSVKKLTALTQRDVLRLPSDKRSLQRHFLVLQRRIDPPFFVKPRTSVKLDVVVGEGGIIREVVIKKSSGNNRFDKYVVNMIEKSSPIHVLANRIGPDAYYRFSVTLTY